MNEMGARCWILVLLVVCTPGETSGGPDCSPTVRSLSSVIDRQKAEQSQRLHLEALFNRYGENGSISMAGLKRLLQSLGLDRIRTVTVQHHEKPGHHHHMHGHHNHHHHGDQDHHHHGDHGHHHHGDHDDSHDDHSHQHRDHQNDKNQHQQQDGVLGHHDDHKHDNHHHDDHNHDDHNHDDHNHDDHNHDDHNHDDHNHDDHHHDHDDHNNGDHGNHQHDNNNEAQDQSPGKSVNSGGSRVEEVAGDDEFEKNKVPESTTTTAPGARRVKREEPTSTLTLVTHTQAALHNDIHEHEHEHEHEHGDEGEHEVRSVDHAECMNASALLSTHGLAQDGGMTLGDFGLLCPALLNQLDQGACVRHRERPGTTTDHKHHRHHHGNHSHTEHSEETAGNTRNIIIAWVGGFISITIISLLSLAGVVLIPLMNKVFFNFLLSFLVALAVGTLSGDAFLHLIPHSQVGHHHHHAPSSDGLHQDHEDHEESLDGVWKGLTALSGVYFMFLIEHFLTLGKMYKDKKHKTQKKAEQKEKEDAEKQTALEENLLKNSEEVEATVPAGVPEEMQVMLTPTPQLSAQGYSEEGCENKCHSHFHDTVGQPDQEHHHHHDYHHILHHHHSQNHHPHSHSHSHGLARLQGAGVASLAWMVVMGDGLHNFSDGLAIGAAFTEGLSSGLSTSVAVFCHELPHELGDFAVLLKAGMTVKQAIMYNVLSAMMAYLGMATGILIGHYAENVSMWIFALTAGLFMYVALVDMMPEMLHNNAGDHGFSHWGFFCLQNAGILLGFGIMLLIAVFEHRIHLDLGQ